MHASTHTHTQNAGIPDGRKALPDFVLEALRQQSVCLVKNNMTNITVEKITWHRECVYVTIYTNVILIHITHTHTHSMHTYKVSASSGTT